MARDGDGHVVAEKLGEAGTNGVTIDPAGSSFAISADRRRWLETLIQACERALAELAARDDPRLRSLLDDVKSLRARLAAELRRG